jgi:DnaJ family protein C protein 17
VASGQLLDPLRRLALDAQLRLSAAKKARFAAYDDKRKVLVTELDARERAFKKSRSEQVTQRAAREGEDDRIKEAGRRMREERERRLEALARTKVEDVRTEAGEDAPPPLGPYDTTIRVKFTLSAFPSLDTASALAAHLSRFGEIDEGAVVLSIKPKKAGKKKTLLEDEGAKGAGEKTVNAVVPFSQIGAAFGVVSSGPTLKAQGMEVSWAGGSEPPILAWLRDRGELGGNLKQSTPSAAPVVGGQVDESQSAKFSTFVSVS